MHANWRHIGELCPIDGLAIVWENSRLKCETCPYMRGGSFTPTDGKVLCNFPQNGSYRDPRPDLSGMHFDADVWNRRMEEL